ncbi:MAG: AAA family ATPase, partial [Rhodococcus sp. (in: high G+C Gram-positive bacteria)]
MTPTFSERLEARRQADQREYWDKDAATTSAKESAQRVHERSMLDAFLTDRVAVFAPDNSMSAFLSILPDAEDVVNSALNSGRMWTDEDGEGDRDVLFFRVDDDTRRLFAPEHLAAHPTARVFASDVGLRLDHQFDQFESAGLNLDDFTPLVEVEAAETEDAERFYAAPQAYATVDMSVLMWNWSRLSANDIRAEAARLDACETDAEAFAELTRQHHAAKAHELARERDNPPPPDDNPEDTMTEDEYDGPCALDLARLRSEPRPPKVWLETGVVAEKSVTKFVAGSGDGKTILIADMAIHHSLGLSALDRGDDGRPRQLDGGPKRVLYIDGEVGEDWWLDYLERFAAPAELPNLFVVSMEDIPALTTDAGVVAMTKLIERYRPDVVVIDTLSSYIEGAENDSDTWIAFDNRITLPLKAMGVTVI